MRIYLVFRDMWVIRFMRETPKLLLLSLFTSGFKWMKHKLGFLFTICPLSVDT